MSKVSNEGDDIFTSLLKYHLYKQLKISLGGRFVSSYLLLSSTRILKKTPKITQHFLCFQEMQLTYNFLINLFPPLYLLSAFDERAHFLDLASQTRAQRVICVNQDK